METSPNESACLPKHNVEVVSLFGVDVAGFWQYGTLTWDDVYKYLKVFVTVDGEWLLFKYDPPITLGQHHIKCLPGPEIVQPGHYMILSAAGELVRVRKKLLLVRDRDQVPQPLVVHENDYRARGRTRDGKCLITGLQSQTYSRLKVVHIFSPARDDEWVRGGYPSKITDTDDKVDMGPEKINSLQNLITLRSDLGNAWDNYEFGVDPKNNHRIIAFANGHKDIDGLYLMLDHIKDPSLCPLNELFIDHFTQCILKHVKPQEGSFFQYSPGDCGLEAPK